jgi:hypothetical protein
VTLLPAVRDAETFFVSTSGHDAWSGLRAEPDREGADGPLATFEAAPAAVSAQGDAPSGDSKARSRAHAWRPSETNAA